MIKISKDNINFWRYFFGGGILTTNAVMLAFVCYMNFWVLYCAYGFIALIHFGRAKVWRYLLISDVYLSDDFKSLTFINAKNVSTKFDCAQVLKYKSYYGITDVYINDHDKVIKFYFMVSAKENLKYLSA